MFLARFATSDFLLHRSRIISVRDGSIPRTNESLLIGDLARTTELPELLLLFITNKVNRDALSGVIGRIETPAFSLVFLTNRDEGNSKLEIL